MVVTIEYKQNYKFSLKFAFHCDIIKQKNNQPIRLAYSSITINLKPYLPLTGKVSLVLLYFLYNILNQ